MIGEELYYNVACTQADEQDKRRQHFDTMATATLGLSGVVVGIMAFTLSEQIWTVWTKASAIGVVFSFIGVAISCLHELWLRQWQIQPQLEKLKEHIPDYEDETLAEWVADQMKDAIENNEKLLTSKAKSLRCAYSFLVAQIAMLVALIITIGFAFSTS